MIAETENQALLFMDPGAVTYPDNATVLVWIKYVPSKSRAVAGMRELSKEFGGVPSRTNIQSRSGISRA